MNSTSFTYPYPLWLVIVIGIVFILVFRWIYLDHEKEKRRKLLPAEQRQTKFEKWISDKNTWILHLIPGVTIFSILFQHVTSYRSFQGAWMSAIEDIHPSKLLWILLCYYLIVFSKRISRIIDKFAPEK